MENDKPEETTPSPDASAARGFTQAYTQVDKAALAQAEAQVAAEWQEGDVQLGLSEAMGTHGNKRD